MQANAKKILRFSGAILENRARAWDQGLHTNELYPEVRLQVSLSSASTIPPLALLVWWPD